MPIYFTGGNAEEAKALIAEMNDILAKMAKMDVFSDVKGFLALERRHHEIAMRLRDLDETPTA